MANQRRRQEREWKHGVGIFDRSFFSLTPGNVEHGYNGIPMRNQIKNVQKIKGRKEREILKINDGYVHLRDSCGDSTLNYAKY